MPVQVVRAEVPLPFTIPVSVVAPVPPFDTVMGVEMAICDEVAQVNPDPRVIMLFGVSKAGAPLVTPFRICPVLPAVMAPSVFASDQ